MKLLVSGATKTLRELSVVYSEYLGCLVVPGARNKPDVIQSLGLATAADNGAFSGLDIGAFCSMLGLYRESAVKLEWVACPDVVGNDVETFRLYERWEKIIRAFGFRPALVLQDGMTPLDIAMLDPNAIFIGGSTDYKLGSVVREIVQWARSKGKSVHMGRVNTERRIRYAVEIGCTSCDGSGFSQWPDKRIPLGIKWIKRAITAKTQPRLIELETEKLKGIAQ